MRRDRREQNGVKETLVIPVEVRTIRTFHGTDGRYHRLSNTDYHARTLDREIRIRMPLVRYGRDDYQMLKEIAI